MTQSSISLLEDQHFFVLPAFKTDTFCRKITLIILAATDNTCTVKSLWNLFEQFLKEYYQSLFATFAKTLAAIMLQDSSIKEFAPWIMKEIIQAIHFEEELQYLEDWQDHPKKKYNS